MNKAQNNFPILNTNKKEYDFSFNMEEEKDNPFNTFNSFNYNNSLPSYSYVEVNFFSLFDDNCINENNLFKKSKINFRTEIIIPKPITEKEINIKIKRMKLSKEDKIKYRLNISNSSTEVNKINEKLIKNKNERRNKQKKKDKIQSINPKLYLSHNKYYPDNIIDKIKNMINNSLITFLNNIIHSIYTKKQIKQIFLEANISNEIIKEKVIRDINYSFIKKKKKGFEILSLLNMTIKDYLFNEISTKYAGIPMNYNEVI